MSSNIAQIYTANPVTVMNGSDLMYGGRSPYASGDDFGITWTSILSSIASQASGTWGINISGNSATATFATTAGTATTISGTITASQVSDFSIASDARITNAINTNVIQGYSVNLQGLSGVSNSFTGSLFLTGVSGGITTYHTPTGSEFTGTTFNTTSNGVNFGDQVDFNSSSAKTVTLDPGGFSQGVGFYFTVTNSGSGPITFSPGTGVTIYGPTTLQGASGVTGTPMAICSVININNSTGIWYVNVVNSFNLLSGANIGLSYNSSGTRLNQIGGGALSISTDTILTYPLPQIINVNTTSSSINIKFPAFNLNNLYLGQPIIVTNSSGTNLVTFSDSLGNQISSNLGAGISVILSVSGLATDTLNQIPIASLSSSGGTLKPTQFPALTGAITNAAGNLATTLTLSNVLCNQLTESTTSRTLAISDVNSIINCTNTGTTIVTVPTNATAAIPIGAITRLVSSGGNSTCLLTISIASGVTVINGSNMTVGNSGYIELLKINTNTWILIDIYEFSVLSTTFTWGSTTSSSLSVNMIRDMNNVSIDFPNLALNHGSAQLGSVSANTLIPTRFNPPSGKSVMGSVSFDSSPFSSSTYPARFAISSGGGMFITNGAVGGVTTFPANQFLGNEGIKVFWSA